MKLYYSDIKQIASAATDAGITKAKESFTRLGLTLSSEMEQNLRESLDEVFINELAVVVGITKTNQPH